MSAADPRPSILAIDTAGPVIGAAWAGPGGERSFQARAGRGADRLLLPWIDALLAEAGAIDAVAVAVGPGAFTGLRVGAAAALGVAVSRGCPVIPLSSLQARALGRPGRVLSVLDARKGRAYAGLYVDGALQGEERDLPPEDAAALAAGAPFVAAGEGAEVWRGLIEAAGGAVAPAAAENPALQIARLSGGMPRIQPAALQLRYLRAPDAKKPSERAAARAGG